MPGQPNRDRAIDEDIRGHPPLSAEPPRVRHTTEQDRSAAWENPNIFAHAGPEPVQASNGAANALVDLERRIAELEAGHGQTMERITACEVSLTDVSARLESVRSEAGGWQTRAEQQARIFEDSLSSVAARQESTLSDLGAFRDRVHQQFFALESSLTNVSNRMEMTDAQVRTVERKLELEHRLYLQSVQDVQAQMHIQDQRLNRTTMAAALAMLLGTLAAGVLVWDAQKNVGILSEITAQVRQLRSTSKPRSMPQADMKPVRLPGLITNRERAEAVAPLGP